MKKRFLATFLALCLALGLLPGTVWAAGDSAPTSGSYGDGVTWTYVPELDEHGNDQGGTLTISGSGAMTDYTFSSNRPWNSWTRTCKNLVIENGVTNIGSSAFSGCSSLTSVTIPDSVTNIGSSAFSGCSSLTSVTIPDSVTNIGSSAFSGCSGLTNVTIPDSVIRMDGAFSDCENLQTINVDPNNRQYSSQDGALLNKEKSVLLFCPGGKVSYTIPNSVTDIENSAFSGCSNLTSITIPNSVTNIGHFVFSGCSSLTNVTIPDSVTNIGMYAFSDCNNLTNATILNGVTWIEYRMFSGCTKLENISIPASVTRINTEAFKNCANLKTINYGGTETQWGQIKIADGNQELSLATLICSGTDVPDPPDQPDVPDTPGILDLYVGPGGLGRKLTVSVKGGHWLTIQTRRAGSIALTSIQAPGSGMVSVTFSASVGSTVQVWETENEMAFVNGIPNNPILNTATKTL